MLWWWKKHLKSERRLLLKQSQRVVYPTKIYVISPSSFFAERCLKKSPQKTWGDDYERQVTPAILCEYIHTQGTVSSMLNECKFNIFCKYSIVVRSFRNYTSEWLLYVKTMHFQHSGNPQNNCSEIAINKYHAVAKK